ncbi:Oligosaccharyltransferase 48 kDa subunit beta-domain-containing protein [Suillus paluster]|uniref:Oligosaccharyltransferase 48 kDa subunit beta-domain-containing protein n=1 Tax=Suillus paluster TaxID=48578 RepID=UPI001B860AF2|nr:Oligosaccharyltransferase 48 kDa subunit beta-domain-containing protein [Suillus paluster]KAG1723524.1 Oligosaccharyltransferase 48 kDa subunit beta-domain-containing protein [Suillus paluster]
MVPVSISALVSLLAFARLSFATSSSGDSVLVDRENNSIFFGGLESYNLTFCALKYVSPAITNYGVLNFDHVIHFAPETKSFAQDIMHHPGSSQRKPTTSSRSLQQTPLTSLVTELSLIPPPPETPFISFHPVLSDPTTIPVPILSSSPMLTPGILPAWFSGAPRALGSSPMLTAPAETPPSTKGGEGLWAGSQMGLVTGFQTNVNSRSLFSDEYARKEAPSGTPSGNSEFARDVAVVGHNRMYTINDEIVYMAHISSHDSKTSTWRPYSSIDDSQLEFSMLDTHIRTSLPPVQFRAPDRHGIFKFVLNWKRKGYSCLSSSTTVPVVLPRHDGYPHFSSAAWPHYTGAISTSVAFFLFAALWLAGDVKGGRRHPVPILDLEFSQFDNDFSHIPPSNGVVINPSGSVQTKNARGLLCSSLQQDYKIAS